MNLKFTFLLLISSLNFLNAQQYIAGRLVNSTPSPSSQSSAICDTVFSFPTVGMWPGGLGFDGKNFWVADGNNARLDRYNMNGVYLDSIIVPSSTNQGGDIDWDGQYLWHVVEQAQTLYKLDTLGNVITQFLLPSGTTNNDPNNFGCAYDNGFVWTTEYTDETLMRIDAATGALVDSFHIQRTVLALKIINGELCGIGLDGIQNCTLYKFDKSNGAIIDSAYWCLEYSLGLCKALEHIWGLSSNAVGIGTKRVYRFNSGTITGITGMESEIDVNIFPNPVSSQLNFTITNDFEKPEYKLFVYDLYGRELANYKFTGSQLSFDTKDLPVGVYLYELQNENGFLRKGRFVKQ